jgi:hypothetical protein
MAKAKSRIPEVREIRIYQGEQAAGALVWWLNDYPDEKAKTRIKRVIALYREAYELCTETKSPQLEWKDGDWIFHKTAETRKLDALNEALNKALQYYQTSPRVEFMTLSNDRGYTFVAPVSSDPVAGSAFARNMKKPVPEAMWAAAAGAGMPHLESEVIQITLDLFKSGEICQIIQCPCGKFVFQRFSHQRFCSEKCRIADYKSSEEFRLKRNAKQRQLYRLHKQHNIK